MISFKDNSFSNPEGLLHYLQQETIKLRPDQKIVFSREWTNIQQRLKGTKVLCHHLAKLAHI